MAVTHRRVRAEGCKSPRLDAYIAIDGERKYQDSLNGRALLVGEEILLLEEYTRRALKEWAEDFTNSPEPGAMHAIRKIGAIAVRAMEHHGALKRSQ